MKPAWLDEALYPFASHAFEAQALGAGGGAMHYLDEGRGEPIVFVHGTPTWSFLWRHLVRDLRDGYRCVAPDHLGFGLSAKPEDADYTPAAHARRLEALIARLELRDVTLVVHDFGGPIGLHYALRDPANVRRVVIMNTWMWSNRGDRAAENGARVLGGPVGRFLYRRLNFSPRVLLPGAYADRSALTPEIHRHYLAPFPGPAQRQAPWVLARELTGSNAWYERLWDERRALADMPMLVLWGVQDRLFRLRQLERWREAFPHARVERLEGAGHFVPEEAPREATRHIRAFLRSAEPGRPEEPGDAGAAEAAAVAEGEG